MVGEDGDGETSWGRSYGIRGRDADWGGSQGRR